MSLTTLFFSQDLKWRREDSGEIVRESLAGVSLAAALGAIAFFVGNGQKYGLPGSSIRLSWRSFSA
jgi:hypothetical protein